jgi:hypothetical protein
MARYTQVMREVELTQNNKTATSAGLLFLYPELGRFRTN